MQRKRFKNLLLGSLLLGGLVSGGSAVWAQAPGPTPRSTVGPPASLHAAIWAETAAYLYRDDKDLAPIQPDLQRTISKASLAAFKEGMDKAVSLEKEKSGKGHVQTFRRMYEAIDQQGISPDDPQRLVAAIINKLDDNPDRMSDPARRQQFEALKQRLDRVATGGVPVALAPTEAVSPAGETQPLTSAETAPDNPMNQPATAPAAPAMLTAPAVSPAPTAPAGSLLWLALAMSGLSLAGVLYLMSRKQPAKAIEVPSPTPVATKARPERSTRQSVQENITWDEVKKYVDRQLEERLPTAATPAALPPLATSPVLAAAVPVAEPAALPIPRTRSQYVNEAPFNGTFPARALSDQPGAYSMFVIVSKEQQPDEGSFDVTGNLASHVRDHRSVLEPVCEYVGSYPLGNETRVVTVEPGTVHRRGADWEVTRKARVRFE